MAITTLDGVVNGLLPSFMFHKPSLTSKGAGLWQSLWTSAGFPGTGSTPDGYTVGVSYTNSSATAGALTFTNNATSYLAWLRAAGAVSGTLILYDRLWSCSGFNTTVTGAQAITNPGVVNRYNSAADGYSGIEIWGEVYTPPGATTATWTVSYKNTTGAIHSAVYTHPASAEVAGQMLPFTLSAGDLGVQSLISFTCSVSSGTAGSIGLTLVKRLAEIPISIPGITSSMDVIGLGMPIIKNSACLAFMTQCTAATSGAIFGSLGITQG